MVELVSGVWMCIHYWTAPIIGGCGCEWIGRSTCVCVSRNTDADKRRPSHVSAHIIGITNTHTHTLVTPENVEFTVQKTAAEITTTTTAARAQCVCGCLARPSDDITTTTTTTTIAMSLGGWVVVLMVVVEEFRRKSIVGECVRIMYIS